MNVVELGSQAVRSPRDWPHEDTLGALGPGDPERW